MDYLIVYRGNLGYGPQTEGFLLTVQTTHIKKLHDTIECMLECQQLIFSMKTTNRNIDMDEALLGLQSAIYHIDRLHEIALNAL